MDHQIRIKFHGVRAIYPVPSKANQTTGGNTSCIEIMDGDSRLFVNAGYGLAKMGDKFLQKHKEKKQPADIAILFSDFLWDSTLGLPSFSPIHDPTSRIVILTGNRVESALDGLNDVTSNIFSPFNGFQSLAAKKEITQVTSKFKRGMWTLSTKVIQNPLTPDGATVWRITHEAGSDIGVVLLCESNEATIAETASFLKGCETLICAATRSSEIAADDITRLGFSEALTMALATNTRSLILTQFHPLMNDLQIQAELMKLQQSVLGLKERGLAKNLSIRLGTELEDMAISGADSMKAAV